MRSLGDKRREMAELKAAANARAGDILQRLGVTARPRGRNGTIAMLDPILQEASPSLVIWLGRPGGLSWKRYGSDARGDIVALVTYLRGWWPQPDHRDAIRWLKDLLGFERMSPAARRESAARAQQAHMREDLERQAELAKSQRWARALYFGAVSALDTPVETYLREIRGVDLRAFPKGPRGGERVPHCARFLPRHKHQESGRELPCMVACCVLPATGEVLAVHRTWLKPDGRGKADVKPARKCFPDFAGLIIPVWKGDSYLSIKEAIANGLREELGVVEGLEDGLAWAASCPERRVWAGISLDNIGNIVLPECIDAVLLARQNDVKRAAIAAYERARDRLAAQGRPLAEVAAMHGKDLSDTLRGAA